mmetsp:Transcript_66177/g.149400  ORF Transcript_66177/g.149400 Transcript_66177/m.149400 type:complete len:268 (+) Transcript_66177:476-1279(+)
MPQTVFHESLALGQRNSVASVCEEGGLLVGSRRHADGLAALHDLLDGCPAVVPEPTMWALKGITEDPGQEALVPQRGVDEVETSASHPMEPLAEDDVRDPAHRCYTMRMTGKEALPWPHSVKGSAQLAPLVVAHVSAALEGEKPRARPTCALHAVEARHACGHHGEDERQDTSSQQRGAEGRQQHHCGRNALVHLHKNRKHTDGSSDAPDPSNMRLHGAAQSHHKDRDGHHPGDTTGKEQEETQPPGCLGILLVMTCRWGGHRGACR